MAWLLVRASQRAARRGMLAMGALMSCAGLAWGLPTPVEHKTSRVLTEAQRDAIAQHLETSLFAALPTEQQAMILGIADRGMANHAEQRGVRTLRGAELSVCFAPGTPDASVRAFHQMLFAFQPRFQPGPRWDVTALEPNGQGLVNTPATITYSFVPDGTPLPAGIGEPAEPSNLFAWMNSLYGSPAVWQPIFDSLFTRWGQVAGLNYVYEPSDDAIDLLPENLGIAGVRGDVRIAAHFIDGNSGVLAYNYFPPAGDMVIDSFDSYFDNTANNSVRLRNVLQHEHGHGLGMFHVCPTTQSKLMEPFISTAYDGVRHDDIRHAQAKYGDRREPNNTPATASPLGSIAGPVSVGDVPPPAVVFASTLSINEGGDEDYFSFSVPSVTVMDVGVVPVGLVYDDAPQQCSENSGGCCFGSFTDSLGLANLQLELRSSTGVVLASSTLSPGGQGESLRLRLTPGQTYVVRVFGESVVGQPQLYNLTLTPVNTALVMQQLQPQPAPSVVAPGESVQTIVRITNGTQVLSAPSPVLKYRETPSGPLVTVPMVFFAPDTYRATLPGFACGSAPSYFFEATTTTGTLVTLIGGSYAIGASQTVIDEQFGAFDPAWTVGPDTASAGFWVRGDPVGTPAQPEDDTSPAGDNACWFTGQGTTGSQVGEADVDGGRTILTSPNYALAGVNNVRVSYRRWFSNSAGASPFQDVFRVEASANNGGTWVSAETLGPGSAADPNVSGGWLSGSFLLSSIGLSNATTLRLRFIAEDVNPGSVVEAAIDDLRIEGVACTPPALCDSIDFNRDTLFPDSGDLDDFIAVLSGGPGACSNFPNCGDVDFNNDGFSPDALDLDAFLSRLSGGACLQ